MDSKNCKFHHFIIMNVEPVVLVPPDVEREESDEARDLHEEVDDDGEPGVQRERVHGGH